MTRLRPSALIVALAVSGPIAVQTVPTAALAQSAPLRAAIHDIPPFGGTTPGGYCFDLLKRVGERTGIAFEFQPMPVGAMNAALSAGTIDVFCSPMGNSAVPGPAPQPAWVGPISINREVLLVAESDDRPLPSLADARSLRVGTIRGTGYATYAESLGIADLRMFANLTEGLTELEAGRIDVFLGAEPLFRYQQDVLGRWTGLKPAAGYVSHAVNFPALGLRPSDAEIITRLKREIDAMTADGDLTELLTTWGLPAPTE